MTPDCSLGNYIMSNGRSSEKYGDEIQKSIIEEIIQEKTISFSTSSEIIIDVAQKTTETIDVPITKQIEFVIKDVGIKKLKGVRPLSQLKNDIVDLNTSQESEIPSYRSKKRKSSIVSKKSSQMKIKKKVSTKIKVASSLIVDKVPSQLDIVMTARDPEPKAETMLPPVILRKPLLDESQIQSFLEKSEDSQEKKLLYNQVLNNSSRALVGQSLNANKKDFKERPLVINVFYTQYEVLEDAAKETNFTLTTDEEEDWDVWWIDSSILPTLIHKMKWYQRTNHLPAIENLARKNLLAKHLNLMLKVMPEEYNFFPQTWILPADAKSFKDQFNGKRAKTFIVKPQYNCQGIGIFLTRNYEWIQQGEHYVAQKYMHKPFLIDGLKFDLRLYVLITGISPLRCFIYKEGLARFATQEYHGPNGTNLNALCMHLTNYAINKEAPEFQQNTDASKDDVGHKRSITSILNHVDKIRDNDNKLPSSAQIWQEIKEICVKTLFAGIHHIDHMFRSSKPADLENSLCFQIFGFDVMLDQSGKPWLLEVNHSPSFCTDSPLDYNIKKNVLRDTLHILNLSWKRKNKYLNQDKNEKEKRLVDFQKISSKQKQTEKEQKRMNKMAQKDAYENSNMGDFQNLYPLPKGVSQEQDKLMELYDLIYFKKSRQVYEESLAGGAIQRAKKDEPQPPPEPAPLPPRKRDPLRTSQTVQIVSPKKKEKIPSIPLTKIGLQQPQPVIPDFSAVSENVVILDTATKLTERKHQTPTSILSAFEGKYYIDGIMIAKLKNHSILSPQNSGSVQISPQPGSNMMSPKDDPRFKALQFYNSKKNQENEKKSFMIKDNASKYLIARTNRDSNKSDLNKTFEKFEHLPSTRSSEVAQTYLPQMSQYAPELIPVDKKPLNLSPSNKNSLKAQFPLKKQTIAQMQLQQKNNLGQNLQKILNDMEKTFKQQQTPKKANIHLSLHQTNVENYANHIMRSNKLKPLSPPPLLPPMVQNSRQINLMLHGNSFANSNQQ